MEEAKNDNHSIDPPECSKKLKLLFISNITEKKIVLYDSYDS